MEVEFLKWHFYICPTVFSFTNSLEILECSMGKLFVVGFETLYMFQRKHVESTEAIFYCLEIM